MSMTTTTDTTETTLVDANEYNQTASGINSWEYEELKKETDRLREKCDKLEKEKAEFLTRRVANLEAPKIQSTEYLKIQQKVNQLATTNEDLKDEKRDLDAKVRELETELASRPSTDLLQRTIAELRSKLSSAEAQIEQIHEEKREAIQQMKDMQEEFEELQDNFREDQSEEFATVKKELDEASKNCRLLQFKLRKVEKRADQLEAEKNDLENRVDSAKNTEKIANLEKELSEVKSEYDKLLRESKTKGGMSLSPGVMKKKSPVLTKAPSGEAVEPPIPSDIDSSQLLRDLQSTLERESDLREQLKFAEEEVTSLRQRINRIEDENESLLIQIKKMSAKSRSDVNSGNKLHDNQMNGDKLDASELKIQLEINDQESKILRRKVEELENSNGRMSKELQIAEDKLTAFEKGTSSVTKSKSVDEVSLLRRKIIEKEREVERLQTELLAVASKNKNKMTRGKSVEADDASKRQEAELRVELKKTQTELSKIKADSESQRKGLENELAKSQNELESQYGKVSQLAEMNKNLVLQMEKFKQDMLTMKEQYETIQDDFVIKNSQLTSMKEDKESALQKLRKEYSTIEKELQALRETFNTRQDTWIKEKLAIQERLKEYELREKKFSSIPGDRDSTRLKRMLDESSKDLDVKKHELSSYKDQIIFMQRENDELRRQLEDFEKVSQMQMRSLSLTETPNRSDQELKVLRERMLAEEKTHRNEIAQMKLRYEQQYALKAEELSSFQSQLSRAKRERDTFRQMVDSAQRAISELKSRDSSSRRDSISGLEEAATGARAAVVSLQDRITSLEDDLSDARRETSRAKTELATEKSTWEMKLGELQQKINEYEEDRLLGSGRNRAAGQRTRLELAWQKERDEQQRRLKEATTLARDLKTTLLEYERERDRDRMENKRRIDQLKGTMEEDQEELRRKIGETQGDLLELRDAHAKLRTANEKLRRDREKLEKERDVTMKKEIEIRRINTEREKLVEDLMAKIMTSQGSNATAAETIRYLQSIKGLKLPEEPTNYKDRKRSNFRRAASVGENEERQSQESLKSSVSAYGQEHYGGRNMRYNTNNSSTLTLPSRGRTPVGSTRNVSLDVPGSQYNPTGSLYRKSLSLEQTVAMPDEQKIWKGDSEAGSGTSIASMDGYQSRGSSVDSRLSTMSSKSEKPKSSSLVKKVKKLVKSKSIEESTTAAKVVQAGVKVAGVGSSAGSGVGSDASLNYDSDRDNPGKKLKDKVKGIFKRSTRSPSVERPKVPPQPPPRSRESTPKKDTPGSTQRPLMPTESQQRPLMPLKR
ncbi:unnamed protein product [Allacma fusca]|uniref:Uncharacterized protein n=1 Tax=Allacma fusca TaxID=39272 RepID=A0A8J2NJ47_9HEXA|nr:unnamed protein product [Allacma fusca]